MPEHLEVKRRLAEYIQRSFMWRFPKRSLGMFEAQAEASVIMELLAELQGAHGVKGDSDGAA